MAPDNFRPFLHAHAEHTIPLRARVPKPCPTCGRMGDCADCCCRNGDHHHPRKTECGGCGHATKEAS